MSLDRFIVPIKVVGRPLGKKYNAYAMDSSDAKKDMRKTIDLGTCHCCDYFVVSAQSIILIEETQLSKTVNKIRGEYHYLNKKDQNEIVNKLIRNEMQLKAYGAMLVLCRLSAKCDSAKQLIESKGYQFWLVASSIDTADERRYFDNQAASLKGDLKGALGEILLDDVSVLTAKVLKKRLSDNATTP